MDSNTSLLDRIKELEELLEVSERKSDILTNLLKEASAEFEQTLEQIKISESNFRAIFENAPESIYIVDIDTRQIMDCNPFTVEWLGYSRRELLSMKVDDILEQDARDIPENIRKAVDDGIVHIQERRFVKKNGRVVDAEVTGTLARFQRKQCFVALVRDVTQRKQVEALSRYKELFKGVSDPVFINDQKGRFLEVNDVACECFGYPRELLLQMAVKDLIQPPQLGVLSDIGEQIQQGRTVQFELDLVIKKGVGMPFEFHARKIQFKGQPAVLSVARNLSVRKKMEEALIKTERLSAVGEMASGVAHNFNNLLQMIMGGSEAALAKLESGKIRESREAINNILNASRRGADVVRRIKDFTLVKTEQMGEAHIFDLDALIKEAVELTETLFWKDPSVPRKYRINYIKGGKLFVQGQPSEIYEVMVNLIKNGLEAMPHGGFLTISVARQNDHIHLTVSDSGHGIPAAHFQRIFEPFFTTKGSKSSGLGLSSCYGIVKKHRGEMQVNSVPGQGSSFTVILPLANQPDVQESQKRVPIEGHKLNFLVIDDEINILKMMEMFFEDTEIDLATALTAKAGLQAIQQDDFDAILCDLSMDDINGLQVGKEVMAYCQKTGKPKIPFLLYTGLEKELDPKKLSESGIDRVVKKPIPCEDLLRLIQEISAPPVQAKRAG
ncbi:MAG: PAS domain S-box protein [Desulfobacteraceae bacterium]|jgi:PAS domain S-box-containing protein|nr:PAS domain S-box protein [Desulfobacteraceae bacterium]